MECLKVVFFIVITYFSMKYIFSFEHYRLEKKFLNIVLLENVCFIVISKYLTVLNLVYGIHSIYLKMINNTSWYFNFY